MLHLKRCCCPALPITAAWEGVFPSLEKPETWICIRNMQKHTGTHIHADTSLKLPPLRCFNLWFAQGLFSNNYPTSLAVSPSGTPFFHGLPLSQISHLTFIHPQKGEISHLSFQKASQGLRILKEFLVQLSKLLPDDNL